MKVISYAKQAVTLKTNELNGLEGKTISLQELIFEISERSIARKWYATTGNINLSGLLHLRVCTWKDPLMADSRFLHTGSSMSIQLRLRQAALARAHGRAGYRKAVTNQGLLLAEGNYLDLIKIDVTFLKCTFFTVLL